MMRTGPTEAVHLTRSVGSSARSARRSFAIADHFLGVRSGIRNGFFFFGVPPIITKNREGVRASADTSTENMRTGKCTCGRPNEKGKKRRGKTV